MEQGAAEMRTIYMSNFPYATCLHTSFKYIGGKVENYKNRKYMVTPQFLFLSVFCGSSISKHEQQS